jgi:MFS family permease
VTSPLDRIARARGGLWAFPDFLRLWAAHTVSIFGSYITVIALPLIGAVTLDATPFQMGLLSASYTLPFLLFGVFVGAWVDTVRRRPLLFAADLLRAGALLGIPAAAALDVLTLPLLVAISFITGSGTVVYEIANGALVPAIVPRDRLIEANSRLQTSTSAAQTTGPAIAGLLVGWLTAPFAILIDALSFVVSALFLRRIEAVEPAPEPRAAESRRATMTAGMRIIRQQPLLRGVFLTSSTTTFCGAVFISMYVLFLSRDLDLGATAIGIVFATGGIGALVGATLAEPLARRIGLGHAIVLGQVVFGLTGLLIPAALLVPDYALPLVIASEFLQWGFYVVREVNAAAVKQAFAPRREIGRVLATYKIGTWGLEPFGALMAGGLATAIGAPATLVLAEIGMLAAALGLVGSSIGSLRTLPPADDTDA